MATAKGISRPIKRKDRTGLVPGRSSTILLCNGTNEDSSTALRIQLLTGKIGLTVSRARLLAGLAWGGAVNG